MTSSGSLMNSVSLYFHIPFCKHKCIYCDFYSITSLDNTATFIKSLNIELEQILDKIKDRSVSTIYFGGGTPSLIDPSIYKSILERINSQTNMTLDCEISFEANPGTLLDANLADFLNAGFNRITIGTQSFQDDELKILSRIHNSEQAVSAIQKARNAGFNNIGIDLIFGIPGQSLANWENNIFKAVELAPDHISMYGLTIEQGTPLDKAIRNRTLYKCDEELERDMYILGTDILEKHGYRLYEISNLAKPGLESQHNQKYWDGSTYYGLGPSAHSFDGNSRWWNIANVHKYNANLQNNVSVIESTETLNHEQRLEEMILLGLRRTTGISLEDWQNLAGYELHTKAADVITRLGGIDSETKPFAQSPSGKLLTLNKKSLALTRQGLLLYDSVCEQLFDII